VCCHIWPLSSWKAYSEWESGTRRVTVALTGAGRCRSFPSSFSFLRKAAPCRPISGSGTRAACVAAGGAGGAAVCTGAGAPDCARVAWLSCHSAIWRSKQASRAAASFSAAQLSSGSVAGCPEAMPALRPRRRRTKPRTRMITLQSCHARAASSIFLRGERMLAAVFGRRDAILLPEHLAEIGAAREAVIEGDVADRARAARSIREQPRAFLEAPAADVLRNRLPAPREYRVNITRRGAQHGRNFGR